MAKMFEKFKDFINPNRKEDRKNEALKAARIAAEQEIAMKKAAEEAEKKRREFEEKSTESSDK